MSDEVLAPIIAVVVLLLLFLWVPTLSICNSGCQKLLRGRRRPEASALEPTETSSDLRDAA